MEKLIHIDLAPNFEDDDYQIIKNILKEKYKKEDLLKSEEEILEIFKNYFPQGEVFFFNSARGALNFLLQVLKDPETVNTSKIYQDESDLDACKSLNEVITQAFSCLVVPNAIKFANYSPIYIDIDKSYNLNTEDLKDKITKRTKAIIIQNTFGIPAKIENILNIAKENKILIIENLTHSLGASYKNNYLGNFGEIALLSFNRNKVISSITGGALVVNNKELAEEIKSHYNKVQDVSEKEIRKILITGKILYEAKNKYNILTKIYLRILRKIGITTEMVSQKEKLADPSSNCVYKMPKNLYPLLLNQVKKIQYFNQKRRKIANIYSNFFKDFKKQIIYQDFYINQESEPIFLRYPVLSENKNKIFSLFKNKNIYLGDWYNCVLAPCPSFLNKIELINFLKKFEYNLGDCYFAEKISKNILNLPTLIEEKDAFKIIEVLSKI
jgi:perosamine synthetase